MVFVQVRTPLWASGKPPSSVEFLRSRTTVTSADASGRSTLVLTHLEQHLDRIHVVRHIEVRELSPVTSPITSPCRVTSSSCGTVPASPTPRNEAGRSNLSRCQGRFHRRTPSHRSTFYSQKDPLFRVDESGQLRLGRRSHQSRGVATIQVPAIVVPTGRKTRVKSRPATRTMLGSSVSYSTLTRVPAVRPSG